MVQYKLVCEPFAVIGLDSTSVFVDKTQRSNLVQYTFRKRCVK